MQQDHRTTVPLQSSSVVYTPEYMAKTTHVSSRLAQKEKKKLLSQTITFSLFAIVLLVVFMFWAVPGLIRLAGALLDQNVSFDPKDDIPPQIPALAAPIEATNSAQLQLSGFTEAKSEVVVLMNGSEHKRVTAADDGTFTVQAELSEGENTFSLYAIDEAKNESSVSRSYPVLYDSEAPKLEVHEPADGSQIELQKNRSVSIKGSTEAGARVYLNDRLAFAKEDGSFSTTFLLNEGENILKFRAEDRAGNVTEKEMKLQFKL